MGLLISFEILECPISKLFFLTSTTFSHIANVLEHYAIHFEVFFKKDYTLIQVMSNHLPMYIIPPKYGSPFLSYQKAGAPLSPLHGVSLFFPFRQNPFLLLSLKSLGNGLFFNC